MNVSPGTGNPGTSVQVKGSGFTPGTTVLVFWLNGGPLGLPLASTTVEPGGGVGLRSTIMVTVPEAGTRNGAYQIELIGSDGTYATTWFTVPAATLEVSPNPVNAGGAISVAGAGYGDGETVAIAVVSAQGVTVTTGSATAGGTGAVSTTVATGDQAAPGSYTVVVTGATTGLSATAPVTIGAPALTLNPADASPGASVTAGGTLWAAGETVTLAWGSLAGLPLGTASAGQAGTISMPFTVPPTATMGVTYTVYAHGASASRGDRGIVRHGSSAGPDRDTDDHLGAREYSRPHGGGHGTNTATPADTATNTATPADTATDTATPADTATDTATPADTATNTATPVDTATNTATPVDTATDTATPVDTATATAASAATGTPTAAATDTPSDTPTSVPVARTIISETQLPGDTEWTADGSPYEVTNGLTVGSGTTLTIYRGVLVLFDAGTGLTVDGTLVAQGSGPTSQFSSSLTAAFRTARRRRRLDGITFDDDATGATLDGSGNYVSGLTLQHVVIEYAGAQSAPALSLGDITSYLNDVFINYSAYVGLFQHHGDVVASDLVIGHSGGAGYQVQGGTTTLSGSSIISSGGEGIEANEDNGVVPIVTMDGGTLASNSGAGIATNTEDLTTPSASVTLSGVTITGNGSGGLDATTATLNATFTITNCAFSNNGQNGNQGAIAIGNMYAWPSTNQNGVEVENNTIENNAGWGIYIYDINEPGAMIVSGNTVTGNQMGGVYVWDQAASSGLPIGRMSRSTRWARPAAEAAPPSPTTSSRRTWAPTRTWATPSFSTMYSGSMDAEQKRHRRQHGHQRGRVPASDAAFTFEYNTVVNNTAGGSSIGPAGTTIDVAYGPIVLEH